jgi:spore germination protein YaaH
MLIGLTLGTSVVSRSAENTSTKEVLGFYTNKEGVSYNNKTFNLAGSIDTVIKNSDKISMAVPFWFKLDQTGKGAIQFESNSFSTNQPEQEAINAVKQMKEKNVKVLGLIHNMLYDNSSVNGNELAHQVLADESNRNNFINEVQTIITKYGLDGINIDIEGVYKSDKDNYTNLIKQLKEKLGSKGYMITVSIPAKTFENPNDSFSYPFDYKGIGQYADRVAIMTYDENGAWAGSGSGPIASIPWQEQVIKYALTQMPKEKIMLGVPVYGFDWTQGKSWPKYSSYQMSMDTANSKGISVQWDQKAQVPYFKYTDETGNREVWFENSQSFEQKINLVYKYDLDGIAIWRLGMEDSQIWNVVGEQMNVAKLSKANVTIGSSNKSVYTQNDSLQIIFDTAGQPSDFTVVIADANGNKITHGYSVSDKTYIENMPLSSLSDGWYQISVVENKNGQSYEVARQEFGINCFGDIKNHWAKDQIIQLYKEGYIKGDTANSFNPEGKLTRAEFIAMMARVLNVTEPSFGYVTKFKDSGLDNHWAKNVILAMEEKGYISGTEDGDGNYYINPNQQITRAEMTAILYNIIGQSELATDNSKFYDIQGHWAEKDIKALEGMNLVSGIKTGMFGPDQTSTRAEAAVVVQRYLDYIKR